MKANIFKYIFFIIVIILIGLAVYLIYKDGKNNVYAVENNEMEINIDKELNIGISKYDTINPILSNNRDVQYIDKLIFEPLLDMSYDFKIENKLAKEFSKINDTTYIVKLEDNIYWHDGEKFTSDDVIFTINSLKNNNVNSIYKENIKEIKEVQKIDEYTIKILLNQKVDFFEYMMCIPILAKHSYDGNFKSKTTIPIGTGRYKIAKIESNNIVLEKVSYEDEAKIIKINISLKENTKELYTALIKNEIDLMITDNIQYENNIGSIGYNVSQYANREFDYLVLNNESSILKDKEIRKAISYSIDRNGINYDVFNNNYKVCDFPLDYGSYLFSQENKIEYDINKTKSILIENGWTLKNNIWKKGNKKLELRLLVNSENEKRVLVAEKIKEQLMKSGININILKVSNNQFNNYIKNKNYDIVLTGNIVSNNPNLETYFADDNLSNFHNQEVNNLLNEIKSVDNQAEILKEKYIKLEQIYKEEMPFIGLYFNSGFIISNKNLKGNLEANWYNIYYNIDNWYKIKDN